MKKRVLSIILAALLGGVVLPAVPAVNVSADTQGFWYNPNNPDASGQAKRTVVLHSEAKSLSKPVGLVMKGTLLDDLGRETDLSGTEWIKVKEHNGNGDSGYIKASDFSVIYY